MSSATSKVFVPLALLLVLAASQGPALAQMVLPGAVAPTPEGATVSPDAGAPMKKPHPKAEGSGIASAPAAKVPAPASLAGQTLSLNGRKSQIGFDIRDKALVVSHLTLSGQRLSNDREACQVEAAVTPIATTDLGKPNGLFRIRLGFPACPIAFDILDGAVLAVGDPPACDFKEADCHVIPDGLWGPQPGAIGVDTMKAIEHARTLAEASVRTDYKLLVTTTKDRSTIMDYAREQAGFSSAREEICRDYSGEGRHGLCSTRLTEARAAALRAKYETEAAHKMLRKAAKKRE